MHEDSYPSTTLLHSPDTNLPIREFKVGDVVFANHVILNAWKDEYDGSIYIAALQGEMGVVVGVLNDKDYVVNFYRGGEQTVNAEHINPYQGHVVRLPSRQW